MLAINDAGLLRRLLALVQTALTATADNQDKRADNTARQRGPARFAGRRFFDFCRRLQHRASNKVVPAGRGQS
jgi:hypothetical protein